MFKIFSYEFVIKFLIGVKDKTAVKKLSVQHKKWWVLIHISFNIIYFTGVLGALTLMVIAKNSQDRNFIYVANYFIRSFDEYLIVIGAIGSLFSGIWISIKTNWGLTKYYWITVKLVGNIFAIVFGSIFVNYWINKTVSLSLPSTLNPLLNPEYTNYFQKLFFGMIFIFLIISFLVYASVLKPWGKRIINTESRNLQK